MPFQIEDYVHRVGRTGRAGKIGHSITFFTKKNFMMAPDLIELLGEAAPDSLKHFAEYADQAKGLSQNPRRRWRQEGKPGHKVVNLSEIIKKRELKQIQKEEEKDD